MLACETRIVRRTIQVLKSCNTSVRARNEAVNSTVMRCNTELDAAHRLAMHANLGAKLAVRFVLSFLRSGWRRFARYFATPRVFRIALNIFQNNY
jgi:hypothetical protein